MANQQGPIFPVRDAMTALPGSFVSPRWSRWLLNLREVVDLGAISIPVNPVLSSSASQPTTDMSGGGLSAGLYAVSWYLAIDTTEPASSAQVTIAWVDQTVPKSYQATLVDGSIANNVQVNQRATFYADGGSPITYTVTYVGATMVYTFRPVLQSVAS